MKRRLLLLIAPVLASVSLVAGPALAPARAAQPAPVVKVNTSSRPLTCVIGLLNRGVCLSLS